MTNLDIFNIMNTKPLSSTSTEISSRGECNKSLSEGAMRTRLPFHYDRVKKYQLIIQKFYNSFEDDKPFSFFLRSYVFLRVLKC